MSQGAAGSMSGAGTGRTGVWGETTHRARVRRVLVLPPSVPTYLSTSSYRGAGPQRSRAFPTLMCTRERGSQQLCATRSPNVAIRQQLLLGVPYNNKTLPLPAVQKIFISFLLLFYLKAPF